MPYLDGRESIKPITSFGKPTEGNSDVKFKKWIPTMPLPKDKLKFGLTHPDQKISQVREKTSPGFGIKVNNVTKNSDYIPCKNPITTFGKFYQNVQGLFKSQSLQIQNRFGSTWKQQKNDKKL